MRYCIEQMFAFAVDTPELLMDDLGPLSDGELRAEEALIREVTRREWSRDPDSEPATLPPDLETWPADLRLSAVLSAVDVHTLSGGDRVRYLQARERLNAAGQASSLDSINAIADVYDECSEDVEDLQSGASLELRSALRWTRRMAESELVFGHMLRVRLPRVFTAFAEGRIDRRRARLLVNHTDHLPTALARTVTDALLEDARRWTTGQLIERVRRACVEVDPTFARGRLKAAQADRRVVTESEPDGTVTLLGVGLDPATAGRARDRINQLARELRGLPGESRTMDQLRADVFADLLTGDLESDRGSRVHLTVDLATLAELKDTAGDLAGYGPVIADIARQVARSLGDGVWEWSATHPTSQAPIADGTTRRRHNASQKRKIHRRDRTCVAPGCRMPTIDCDIDHTRRWADTGTTNTEDSALLCRHDHCTNHQTGWSYRRLPDGDYQWTSPLGTTYTTSGRDP